MNEFFTQLSNGYPYLFVLWNLFLALIPCYIVYFLGLVIEKSWYKTPWYYRLSFALLFVAWFFFYPNTAYLFTEVRYLLDYCKEGFDAELRLCNEGSITIMFYFLYAVLGLPMFYYALRKMTELIRILMGPVISFFFTLIYLPIAALGMLLGLLDRLNSWDVAARPQIVLETAYTYVSDPQKAVYFAVYSLTFYITYYFIGFILNNVFRHTRPY